MAKEKKPMDPAKFHKDYLAWKKESKSGKKCYYINNVVIPALLATAFFALVLIVLPFLTNRNLTALQTVLYVAVFLVVYGGLLFLLYAYTWKQNTKKYASYEEALFKIAKRRAGEEAPEELVPSEEDVAEAQEALSEEEPVAEEAAPENEE